MQESSCWCCADVGQTHEVVVVGRHRYVRRELRMQLCVGCVIALWTLDLPLLESDGFSIEEVAVATQFLPQAFPTSLGELLELL